MKRKSLIAFMICLMGITLLIGCSKGSDSNNADKEENVTESAESDKDEDSDDKNKDEDKDGKKSGKEEETEEAKGSGDDLDLAGAFKEGRVFNNGSYFVLIKDKVYFRNISPGSMEKGATFGEFLRTEFYPTPCPLISYNINTCEWDASLCKKFDILVLQSLGILQLLVANIVENSADAAEDAGGL